MLAEPAAAQAFIRRQMGDYLLLGITTMTLKQRERITALEVISPERKLEAAAMLHASHRFYGWPPHQRTGTMRRLNIRSGEIVATTRTPVCATDRKQQG